MKKLDKNSPLPLYYQLKNLLCEMIENEELKPDAPIPSEREICEKYGISRMTANKAIVSLVTEGILYREQGKGTFVARNKEKYQLSNLLSFSEEMRKRGEKTDTKLLSFCKKQPTKRLREELCLKEDQAVFEIIRLRYITGNPYALETAYIPVYLCDNLHAKMLESQSLYRILEEKFELCVEYAYQTLEPTIINDYESETLGIAKGALAILLSRKTYLKNDIPVEFTKAIYRGDRYKFEILLKR